jgi:hypothetical protein
MQECKMPNCGARQEHLVCDRCLTYELSRPQEYITWPADQLALLVDACTQRIEHYSRQRAKILGLRTWGSWKPAPPELVR